MICVDKKEMCCGCSACVNCCPKKCITMKEDREGFLYPEVNRQECTNCGLCEKVCPVLNKTELSGDTRAYAVFACEDGIREKSSSGGVFSLLAEQVLCEGGYVFGCAFDAKLKAEHIGITDYSELKRLQGSKYVQSDLKSSFHTVKQLLEEGKQVLFSGTACQMEGLKKFLGKHYESLLLVDVVCHGVPSPKVWEQYKEYQERIYDAKISGLSFRDKSKGWKDYRVMLNFENGQTYVSRSWDDIYMKSFIKNLISRPSCYDCKFRQWHRESDITLGDFWGAEQVLPQWNDDKGISLVLIHSEKGQRMLQSISEKLRIKEVEKEAAVEKNRSVIAPIVVPKEREKFFAVLNEKGYDAAVQKYVKDGFLYKAKNALKRLLR